MSRMTHQTRRRWHNAIADPYFALDDTSATLTATQSSLRHAVGCRTNRDFQRQLQAAQHEGWLQTDPNIVIDLAQLDELLRTTTRLSTRGHLAAKADHELLESHGISINHANNYRPTNSEGQPVTLAELAEIFGHQSLGSAQWRLTRIRHSLTSRPSSEPASLPHQSPVATSQPAGAEQPTSIAERILDLLDTEEDPQVRRSLAAALTPALTGTAPQDASTSLANDSRSKPRVGAVRESFATSRDTPTRGSLELVPEQELPIPIQTNDPRITKARSRKARKLPNSTDWTSISQLEPIIRPFETLVGALGPKARQALMSWDPPQVQHAINMLTKWVEGGFELTNPSGYVITAANAGYLSLFPLTTPTKPAPAVSQWAQRALTTSPQTCLDLIDQAHGPQPGRSYDPERHLQALIHACLANPNILDLYSPTEDSTPSPDALKHAVNESSP